MTLPSIENQCSDVVTDAANLSDNKDASFDHVDDEEDEEADVDFNPFLKEAPSLEASSSLSSEIEEFDADVADSGEIQPPINDTENEARDDDVVENVEQFKDSDNTALLCNKENEPNIATHNNGTSQHTQNLLLGDDDDDDEDAIWRRTRARYSLVGSTLDELETFLQETDDEDELHNIDDEEEYRKFLAAVLLGGDGNSGEAQEQENVDEDEDNDADFELELEEALGSDIDEDLRSFSPQQKRKRAPETRQKKRQKTDLGPKKFSGETSRPLRPILPFAPISPSLDLNVRNYMIQTSANNDLISPFTPQQIGQLHCLIYEHVQLLIQVFSLSVLDPSKQHVSNQVQGMLSEMVHNHDQVLASQRVPYPSFCFNQPYIQLQKDSFDAASFFSSSVTNCDSSSYQPVEGFFWVPFVSEKVLSVIDVAPLNLVRSYIDDISIAVKEHQKRQLEVSYDATADRECLFPFESFRSSPDEPTTIANDQKSKKSIAASLVERSKKQSIALVPKVIAKSAQRFFPLFNPALFPHKPPPVSVANRVLFTDSEDRLLALGLMKYNTNWKEIQKNYLPGKSAHQIFVRQKNRSCSRAPENPIKAVRRMKTSPLTPQEKARIQEGLKMYKLDWLSVWKYMVPHRDPLLLARQWRTAIGNQKSYKVDEHRKEKRRIYESKRRKSKVEGGGQNRESWSTEEDINQLSRSKTVSNKEKLNTDNGGDENNSGDDGGNNEDEAYVHEAFLADWRPGMSSNLSNLVPVNHNLNRPRILREVHFQSGGPRVVKLAPDLPAVNLPPTVRIMSQSAFTKYQDEVSSKARERVENSDLQMHPLLFQHPEDGSLPYYPLNRSAVSSSSFDFFPNNPNPPQLNLNLFHPLKSNELSSAVDFHPLLQRTDDRNHSSNGVPQPAADSVQNSNAVPPPSPNELDLDIRLSSTSAKDKVRNDPDLSDEIVMEQEELSDSEDEEITESVEFECEEMTDSDSDDNLQNEDFQDESDQDESRCRETSNKKQPKGLRLNPKLPVTRNSRNSLANRSSTKQVKKLGNPTQKQDPR